MLPVKMPKTFAYAVLVCFALLTVDYIKPTDADSSGTDTSTPTFGVSNSSSTDLVNQTSYETQDLPVDSILSTSTLDTTEQGTQTTFYAIWTTATSFDDQMNSSAVLEQTSNETSGHHAVNATVSETTTPTNNTDITLSTLENEIITSPVSILLFSESNLLSTESNGVGLVTPSLLPEISASSLLGMSATFLPSFILSTESNGVGLVTPSLLPEISASSLLGMSATFLPSFILSTDKQSDILSYYTLPSESLSYGGYLSDVSTTVWTPEVVSTVSSISNQSTINLTIDLSPSDNHFSDLSQSVSTPLSFKSDSDIKDLSTTFLPPEILSTSDGFSSDVSSNVFIPASNSTLVISDPFVSDASYTGSPEFLTSTGYDVESTVSISFIQSTINLTIDLSPSDNYFSDLSQSVSTPLSFNSDSDIMDLSTTFLPPEILSTSNGFSSDVSSNVFIPASNSTLVMSDPFVSDASYTGSPEFLTSTGYDVGSTVSISFTLPEIFSDSYVPITVSSAISSNLTVVTDILATSGKFTIEETATVSPSPPMTATSHITPSPTEIMGTNSILNHTTQEVVLPSSTVQTVPEKSPSSGGLSTGGKVALGIIIPIAIIGLVILGVVFYRRYTASHRSLKDFLQASVRYRTYTNNTYTDDEAAFIVPP